jgi:outer membrane protein assembly factor BamB
MKRRAAILLVAMLILTMLAGPAATLRPTDAQDAGGDVPMFRGNAARTGEMPGPGPTVSDVLWIYTANNKISSSVSSSPAVVDGVVYVGSDDFNLYALDSATGGERWRFRTGGKVTSSPAVVDGVVYVGSWDNNLYAIDAATGEERWRFTADSSISGAPAVADGVVVVGSLDGGVYGIDAVSGNPRWRFATESGVASSPAVVDGVVYVGSSDSSVYALDAATGAERWRFATGGDVSSSPAVVDGVVYVGSADNNVYALDTATGTERWRFATRGDVSSSPAVVDGVVYVGSYDDNVYALDAATGTERWRFATGGSVSSSPAVVGGVVYVGSYDNNVYAVDAATGTERWQFATRYGVISSPAVADGVLYVGSNNGKIYAIGLDPNLAANNAQATTVAMATQTAVVEAALWPNYFADTAANLQTIADSDADLPWGRRVYDGAESKLWFVGSAWTQGMWYPVGFTAADSERSGVGVVVYDSDLAADAEVASTVTRLQRYGWGPATSTRLGAEASCLTSSRWDGSEAVCFVQRGRVVIIGYASLATDVPETVLATAADMAYMGMLATEGLVVPE